MTNDQISEHESSLLGEVVSGRVEAVFHWGVIVDLGLSCVGLIDILYIDDDDAYQVGATAGGYLDCLDEQKNKFILRPVGQTSLADRLERKRREG